MAVEFDGLEELNAALSRLAPVVSEEAQAGLFAGGLIIQRESQKNTPVEYNVLRASAFTNKKPKGVEVGYGAEYAIYVHENMEQTLKGEPRESGLGTYWNPGGPKFLEKAVNENAGEVFEQVRKRIARVIK